MRPFSRAIFGEAVREFAISTRPLMIVVPNTKVRVHKSYFVGACSCLAVPLGLDSILRHGDVWIAAEVLKNDFAYPEAIGILNKATDNQTTLQLEVDLFVCFLSFVAQRLSDDPQFTKARTSLFFHAFTHLVSSYFSDTNTFFCEAV
jgi:hypothetical protein